MKQSATDMISQNVPFDFNLLIFPPDEKLVETSHFPKPYSSAGSTRPSFHFLEFVSPEYLSASSGTRAAVLQMVSLAR